MATYPPIQFIRSSTPGAQPTTSDILVGELAINLQDRRVYTKDTGGNIIELGFNKDYDSDILYLIQRQLLADSDIDLIKHNFLAGDSDLLFTIQELTLDDLKDVQIVNPTEGLKDGQFLRWDSDADLWINEAIDADYGTF